MAPTGRGGRRAAIDARGDREHGPHADPVDALTARFADGDHGALSRLAVEFASPHVVGQPLTMQAQADGSNAFDFAVHSGGEPVLLGGRAELG